MEEVLLGLHEELTRRTCTADPCKKIVYDEKRLKRKLQNAEENHNEKWDELISRSSAFDAIRDFLEDKLA